MNGVESQRGIFKPSAKATVVTSWDIHTHKRIPDSPQTFWVRRAEWAAHFFGKATLQQHHIYPQSLKNHKVFQLLGFDIDDPRNVVLLPTKKGMLLGIWRRSPHQGSHYETYMVEKTRQLDLLYDQM